MCGLQLQPFVDLHGTLVEDVLLHLVHVQLGTPLLLLLLLFFQRREVRMQRSDGLLDVCDEELLGSLLVLGLWGGAVIVWLLYFRGLEASNLRAHFLESFNALLAGLSHLLKGILLLLFPEHLRVLLFLRV